MYNLAQGTILSDSFSGKNKGINGLKEKVGEMLQ